MARAFGWAVVAATMAAGMSAASGCIIVAESGGTGGTSGSTTSGSGAGSSTSTTTYMTTTSTTGTGLPVDCKADTQDDACTACNKASCCVELQDCLADSSCDKLYQDYSDCLYPGGNDWSGYTSGYCKAAVGADTGKAAAIIDCVSTKCSSDTTCGTQPVVTYDNFANEFMEKFCNGCHFPGYGEAGHLGFINTDDFSNDSTWDEGIWGPLPLGNPDWKNQGNYDVVKANADKIWCGVSSQLPSECATKFPGKFPKAKRFPPSGITSVDHNGDPVHCWWNPDDGQTCDQPTDVDRAQMASWIFDGMPK